MASTAVTFVVPNYNGARYLAHTLESILAQQDPDFVLILADNQSTDDSVPIAESYRDPRLIVIRAGEHVSMAANWNRAFTYVRTPFAVLAHADDIYEPEYLSVVLPLLRRHEQAFAAHCNVINIDEHGGVLRDLPVERYKAQFWPTGETYSRTPCDEAAWLRRGNYISAPATMYRMAAVQAIGPFETRFQFVTDWEYWLRGVFAGYTIAGTRRRLLRYRRHSGSLTKAAETTLRRYDEEIELLQWLAARGFAAGCFADERPDYGLVTNTLMSELADRLSAGDRDGARRLAAFARNRIPGFRGSARDVAGAAALSLGAAGGRALVAMRQLYLRTGTGRAKVLLT
jgi:glycosyltransferase involved in cell wall biosynthesis